MNNHADILDILFYLQNNNSSSMLSHREQLKYYLTKYIVELPLNLNQKLNLILQNEINQNPIIYTDLLPGQIVCINEDITQLKCDAIVNAANANGLGCFNYNHKCIDNIIHNKAGPMLRIQCQQILRGLKLRTSDAMITSGFNLPSDYIIHTVGPIWTSNSYNKCIRQLSRCYINCLSLAIKYKLQSIAFCCISTGVYGLPSDLAAKIAIYTIKTFLSKTKSAIKIIFCTYADSDFKLYQNLLMNS